MRLETLTIRGLLAFGAPVTIDLRDLPPGLIAICGANGSGKTTLVDGALAVLYRQLPSRGDKELVDYAHDREAYLEATIAVDGRGLYRARVNVDGVRRQSEAILQLVAPDGSVLTLNDGKVSTFDAVVARTFPPLAVVLASAFAAQNRRGSFITLDRRGRKELFAELLGLRHYEILAQGARDRATTVQGDRAARAALRDRLTDETGEAVEAALAERANRLQADAGQVEFRRQAIEAALARIQADRASVVVAAAQYAEAQTVRDRLSADCDARHRQRGLVEGQRTQLAADAAADRARLDRQAAQTRARLQAEEQTAATEHAAAITHLATQIATERDELDTRIANNERLLADAPVIRQAQANLTATEAELTAARQALESALATARELAPWRAEMQAEIGRLEAVGRDRDRAARDAALLGSVPCQGARPYADCQFLVHARAAAERRPDLETELAKLDPARADLARAEDQSAAVERQAETARATIASLEARLADLKTRTRHADQIALAEGRLADYRGQLERLDSRAAEERQAADARLLRRQGELTAARARLETETAQAQADLETRRADREATLVADLEAIDAALVQLAQQIDNAERTLAATAEAHQRLAEMDAEIRLQERAWTQTDVDRARLEAEVETLARDRHAVAGKRAELATLRDELARLDQDLLEWQLLARILGRDGLPVLEIDAAGPLVSGYCNDLLQSCFGPRFTVELVTQEAKLSGKGLKETFELRVFDGEQGGEPRDLTDLSGGEQILVDEALKSALAMVVNQRLEMPIRTCWRDETTGALDGENVGRYVAMLRRLQQIAGFHHVIFVSHSADAAAQADAQLLVRDGAIRLVLPPYAEAA